MSDPLSVTVGVIGTAAIALRSVKELKDFVENIEGAPGAIDNLITDLSALDNVLQTLEATVTDPTFSNTDTRARILNLVHDPLQNCIRIVNLTSAKLNPYVKVGNKAKKSKWKGFVWTFRSKQFTDLKALLLAYKSSLEIALSAVTLTNSVTGFADLQFRIKKMQRKLDIDNASIADSSRNGWSTTQTEHNFALKRFLLDTDSICGDVTETFVQQSSVHSNLDDHFARPQANPRMPYWDQYERFPGPLRFYSTTPTFPLPPPPRPPHLL